MNPMSLTFAKLWPRKFLIRRHHLSIGIIWLHICPNPTCKKYKAGFSCSASINLYPENHTIIQPRSWSCWQFPLALELFTVTIPIYAVVISMEEVICLEELESSQGSRGISWRLFPSSRVRWGAGRKGGTWASRRLGQARTILRASLRKGDVFGREEKYRSWKLAPFKNCVKSVTLTHKGGTRSLNLLTAQ